MVVFDDLMGQFEVGEEVQGFHGHLEDVGPQEGMGLYDGELLPGQLSRFLQDAVGYPHFSYVMERGGPSYNFV